MENTDIASKYGVQSIPLMVLFKNGQPVAQKLGAAGGRYTAQIVKGTIELTAPCDPEMAKTCNVPVAANV